MSFLSQLTFDLAELIALLGFGQCLLVFVHLLSRMGRFAAALPYLLFFTVLALGFGSQLLFRLEDYVLYISFAVWVLWSMTVPAAVVMVLAIVRPHMTPTVGRYGVYLLFPLSLLGAGTVTRMDDLCGGGMLCPNAADVFMTFGMIALTMCFLFFARAGFTRTGFLMSGHSAERYWLTVALVVVSLAIIASQYAFLNDTIDFMGMNWAWLLIGLVFVYLTSTLIFRIYPPVLALKPVTRPKEHFNEDEKNLRDKIERLMKYEKLYQEPSFGRSDLARELALPEGQVSTIVNRAFGKNLSQYINGYRIHEAQYLLRETDLAVAEISELSGFNSLASFNRVFKEISGTSPRTYRKMFKTL